MRRRLESVLGVAAGGVRVMTARELALAVLAEPEARQMTGRPARLLDETGCQFLQEDLLVSGLRPKRLSEMLKFFYRTWAELGDRGDWLIPGEEADVHAMVKDNLRLMGAYLEPELANQAVACLEADPSLRDAVGADTVLVDDFQQLSRASQRLCELMARRRLWAAADAEACAEVFDSHPYPDGVAELAARAWVHERLEIPRNGERRFGASLAEEDLMVALADEALTPDAALAGRAALVCADTPTAELIQVAQLVDESRRRAGDGTRVVVACPHRLWVRNVARVLAEAGVPVAALDLPSLTGDIHREERSGAARILALLRLAADGDCAPAWRAWCGFGDPLARSGAFEILYRRCSKESLPLPEALRLWARDERAVPEERGMRQVASAVSRALEIMHATRGLTGEALVAALAEGIGVDSQGAEAKAVLAWAAPLGEDGDGDAVALVRRIEARLSGCAVPDCRSGDVLVASYQEAAMADADETIVVGLVNGLTPPRAALDPAEMPLGKQIAALRREGRLLYEVAGKCRGTVTATAFREVDLEAATRLKLKIERIFSREGRRYAIVSPSVFAPYL